MNYFYFFIFALLQHDGHLLSILCLQCHIYLLLVWICLLSFFHNYCCFKGWVHLFYVLYGFFCCEFNGVNRRRPSSLKNCFNYLVGYLWCDVYLTNILWLLLNLGSSGNIFSHMNACTWIDNFCYCYCLFNYWILNNFNNFYDSIISLLNQCFVDDNWVSWILLSVNFFFYFFNHVLNLWS